jgi:hypothetical protein
MKKPKSAAESVIDLGLTEHVQTSSEVAIVESASNQVTPESQRDLVNQLLGQAQAFSASADLLRTFGVSKLAYVKENKLYKALDGMKTPNGSELSGTWEEFCGLLHVSVDKADEDISNLRAFGEGALERMSSMGIGYRQLRQFRKLSDDKRTALGEVAQTGDKEDLLEYAEELLEAERAAQEELAQAHKATTEEVATLKKREKNYEAELERAQLQIKRLGETKKRLTEFEPRTEDVRSECMALQLEAELPMNSLQKLFEEVVTESESTPESRLRIEQIWVTANIVASTALETLSKICDLAASTPDGNDLPIRALGPHILTPEEAQNWLLSRPLIENRHDAEKALRQEKRESDKPKGPGRPKGSKNSKVED